MHILYNWTPKTPQNPSQGAPGGQNPAQEAPGDMNPAEDAPGDPRRLQEARIRPRRPQEARIQPGDPRRPESSLEGPRKFEFSPGDPRSPLQKPTGPEPEPYVAKKAAPVREVSPPPLFRSHLSGGSSLFTGNDFFSEWEAFKNTLRKVAWRPNGKHILPKKAAPIREVLQVFSLADTSRAGAPIFLKCAPFPHERCKKNHNESKEI